MKFNEFHTVEKHILEFLAADLGYSYIEPKEFKKLREFENEYLIVPHLSEAIKRINGIDDETLVQTIVREIKKVDTNEGFLKLMRDGVNLKDPETGKKRDFLVVDFENHKNNDFIVTNQFYFVGNSENIRPDILIFLNGFPIVDIEAKSPTASAFVDYEKAIDQLVRYQKVARKLFLPNCFNIATDGLKTVYGATGSPKQYYSQWKDEGLEEFYQNELDMSLYALLLPERLLDMIQNFMVFEHDPKTKHITKKICRYQQYRAANKIVDRVVEGQKKKGLIWHTQGSGKSLTMFFTAWKLRFAKELKNPKVFILVDRIDLDDQIYGTFVNCGGKNVIRATSRKDLQKHLTSPTRGIFISTIQKFNELPNGTVNDDANVIVLSDEAHRDNEGVAAINLRSSMKNAYFFGFTGTPIDKKTLNTHRNFGEEGERYLDYYSIQQAIEDGATLPVTFEARLSKFFIDEDKVDQQFDELAGDLTDEQKQVLTKKYGKKSALIKLDKRIEAVARDMVEHFRAYIEPNGFKAQIVCYDREACAKYKKVLDQIIPKEWTAIVYSPGDPNSDADDLKKYNTNKSQREKLIKRFKRKDDPLRFLIVCDMLLTGFDAPNEQVMYLDKPLRDHNLLQAIARTNRVYPNKGCGRIIDYYGITRNLHEALNFDESIVESSMINIDEMKKLFEQKLKDVRSFFKDIDTENPSMENLRKALKIFIDDPDKQQKFTDNYSHLKLLFEVLSPDPFLKPHLRIFEWLTSFYLAFSKEFKTDELSRHELSEYGEKMKDLIQGSIDYEGITKNFREMNIHDIYVLERLKDMEPEEQALSLEKMMTREITSRIDAEPLFQKFSERLSTIRQGFEQHQIDLSERIKKYYELLEDMQKVGEEAEKLGLDVKEFALYTLSEEFVESNQEIATQLAKNMSKNLESILDKGWQNSSKSDYFISETKKMLQELLLKEYKGKLKISDFHAYLNRLLDVIKKKF